MTALLKALAAGAWKPIALLLAALGLYAKINADASAKERAKTDRASLDTIRRIQGGKDAASTGGSWRDRLRKTRK